MKLKDQGSGIISSTVEEIQWLDQIIGRHDLIQKEYNSKEWGEMKDKKSGPDITWTWAWKGELDTEKMRLFKNQVKWVHFRGRSVWPERSEKPYLF